MNWKFWKKKTGEEAGKPKSKLREWGDAILFAVVAATLIRWLIMEAYTIPTSSMENSLSSRRFSFREQVPLRNTNHQHTVAGSAYTPEDLVYKHPSYSEAIKLPQYRLAGNQRSENAKMW